MQLYLYMQRKLAKHRRKENNKTLKKLNHKIKNN